VPDALVARRPSAELLCSCVRAWSNAESSRPIFYSSRMRRFSCCMRGPRQLTPIERLAYEVGLQESSTSGVKPNASLKQ
jgi:hypothetical protein